jgi:hypothetical protein
MGCRARPAIGRAATSDPGFSSSRSVGGHRCCERAESHPWNRVGFEGGAVIDRKDFGITYNAVLETGGVMISENHAGVRSVRRRGCPTHPEAQHVRRTRP